MAEGGEIESLQLETKELTVRAPARRRLRRRPEGAPPAPVAPPGGREGARAPPPPASSTAGPGGWGGALSAPQRQVCTKAGGRLDRSREHRARVRPDGVPTSMKRDRM